ncbi:MAG: rnhA operon protein [Haloferacaceae archaeon]
MPELPDEVVDDAERLTRLERDVVDPDEMEAYRQRREELLTAHGFTARVREDDDTLVLHPEEWLEDGVARMDRIEDTDRAVEVSLSGAGDPENWHAVEDHNRRLVEAVGDEHGDVHVANARAFADFMGNHYARRVETATAGEVREFLEEYYPRNAWPSAEERAVVGRSLELLFDAAGAELPDSTAELR